MRISEKINNINNLYVLGGGVSGAAAAKLGLALGLDVTVIEANAALQNHSKIKYLSDQAEFRQALQENKATLGNSLLILSSGIRPDNPIIDATLKAGVPLVSELDFALMHIKKPVVAITGSNGKSTTTQFCAHGFEKHGLRAVAAGNIAAGSIALSNQQGGNIGKAACDIPEMQDSIDVVVFELSSYQLHYQKLLDPVAAAIVNISPDHLDWHGNLESYVNAKSKVQGINAAPVALGTSAASALKQFKLMAKVKHPIEITEENKEAWLEVFPGLETFNQENFAAAEICINASGLVPDFQRQNMAGCLDSVRLPFRFAKQKIGTATVINDSKSTNAASLEAALHAVKALGKIADCTVLLGGQKKPESFSPLRPLLQQCKNIVIFGASSDEIMNEIAEGTRILLCCRTLKECLDCLQRNIETKSQLATTLLFSPGCASFDEFKNFEHRGAYFNDAVKYVLK